MYGALTLAFLAGATAFALPSFASLSAFFCGISFAFFLVRVHLQKHVMKNANETEGGHIVDRPGEALRSTQQNYFELLGKYELLVNNIAAAIIVRDESNQIIFCSPYTEVLFGFPPNEVLLMTEPDLFVQITSGEEAVKHIKALALIQLCEPYQYRFQYLHRSGIPMWAETRMVPIVEEDGRFVGSLSISIDVTANVRYEQRIEEKNRDLNDFAYMVSHDLKAPIYTVKGMTNLLSEELPELQQQGEVGEALSHISGAVQSLESLVSGILEYSRVSQHEIVLEPIELRESIRAVERDYRQLLIESGGTVHVVEPLPLVLADQRSIYQIFSNLLGNALKYYEQGRSPTIEISSVAAVKHEMCQIVFKDNGCGIAHAELDKIFRPFHRSTGKKTPQMSDVTAGSTQRTTPDGLGIGLACVHKLVERLGGEISVESTLGVGSTFRVSLPCVRP
jgi:PAS domain S-box-containing protein